MRASSLESRIVAYADKRAGQRLEPMDGALRLVAPPVPAGAGDDDTARPSSRSGHAELERVVCEAAGVDPAGVRRLRWSRRALRDAAA